MPNRLSNVSANKIFVISGTPGLGKKILAKYANKIGCLTVPKHTDRSRNPNDGSEMIFPDDPEYNLENCKFKYVNYNNKYGIDVVPIWENLIMKQQHQVLVCSDIEMLRKLRTEFNEAIISIYVHSDMNSDEYMRMEEQMGSSSNYIKNRAKEYKKAHEDYANHFTEYDKSMIYTGDEKEILQQLAGLFCYTTIVNQQMKGVAKG